MANLTVMVIDDDDFTQELLQGMLEAQGISEVHQATDGRKALRQLAALPQPPDALICDVFMPDMDGIEFLDELAKLHYAGGVVLISGMDMTMLSVARDMAVSQGLSVLGAFIKPVTADVLAQALGLCAQLRST